MKHRFISLDCQSPYAGVSPTERGISDGIEGSMELLGEILYGLDKTLGGLGLQATFGAEPMTRPTLSVVQSEASTANVTTPLE